MKTIENDNFKKFFAILSRVSRKLRKISKREGVDCSNEKFNLIVGEVSLLTVGAFEICQVDIPDDKTWKVVKDTKEIWDGLDVDDIEPYISHKLDSVIKDDTKRMIVLTTALMHTIKSDKLGITSKKSKKNIDQISRLLEVFMAGVGKVQNDLEKMTDTYEYAILAWDAIPTNFIVT